MKTIYVRRIRNLALLILAVGLNYLIPRLWALTKQLSLFDHEIMFNVIFLALAFVFWFFFLFLYPFVSEYRGPFRGKIKCLAPLVGALVLIVGATALYILYGYLRVILLDGDPYGLTEIGVQTRLSENLLVLRYAVPGVMLSVAANLITIFLHSEKLNSDKSPHD